MKESFKYFPSDGEKFERIQEEQRRFLLKLSEQFLHTEEYQIGKGRTAEVHQYPEFPNKCLKIICDKTINWEEEPEFCSLAKEAEYLDTVRKIKDVVRVPRPFFSAILKEEEEFDEFSRDQFQVLTMQRLKAVSLRDIIENGLELPKNFNIDEFFEKLRNFVDRMHQEAHIYHRDLHVGNIMVDKSSRPYIIDFGSAIYAINDEDAYSRETLRTVNITGTDESKLRGSEQDLRRHLKLTL